MDDLLRCYLIENPDNSVSVQYVADRWVVAIRDSTLCNLALCADLSVGHAIWNCLKQLGYVDY